MATGIEPEGIARLGVEIEPRIDAVALETEWRALLERSEASFFLSWPWIATWLEHRPGPVLLARVRNGAATVALALLGARTSRLGPLPFRTLHLHASGDPEADRVAIEHNDILAARGHEAAARRAILSRLLHGSDPSPPREVVLPMVGEAMETAAGAAGLRSRRRGESRCAAVDLEALRRSGGGYLAGLGASTRGQIRRAARLYAERGALRIDVAAEPEEAIAWLESLAELHEARFRAKGGHGSFGVPGFAAFHRALIRRAWGEGSVEVLRASAGDQPIGYLYNFRWRGWVGFYASGLAYGDDNRLKPGLVTHWLAIERYLADGARVYDLMAGESRYKASLAEPGPLLLDLVVTRDDLLARLADGLRRVRDRLASRARPKA